MKATARSVLICGIGIGFSATIIGIGCGVDDLRWLLLPGSLGLFSQALLAIPQVIAIDRIKDDEE